MHASEALSFLQTQIDHIAVPIFVADEDHDSRFRFVAANQLYAALRGVSKNELIGRDPDAICADFGVAGVIIGKCRLCVSSEEPVRFRERITNGQTAVLVDTTLHKVALGPEGRHRIVGTAIEVQDRKSAEGDIGFYVSLARNSLMTIEMLMGIGRQTVPLTATERQATEILTRKALAALDDADRTVRRLAQSETSADAGLCDPIRRVVLH